MRYLVVGDVHGIVEAVEKAISYKDYKKIFIGDIMDSYDRSPQEQGKCLDLILDSCEMRESHLIWGNHELSYYWPETHKCSGYNIDSAHEFSLRKNKWREYGQPSLWIHSKKAEKECKNILVTHAGLSADFSIDPLDSVFNEDPYLPKNILHKVGKARGGSGVGGIFWCDWNSEFRPIEGLIQIVGHTHNGSKRRSIENNYNIDWLENDPRTHRFLTIDENNQIGWIK